MRISTRKKILMYLGLVIMLFQFYKYATNQMFEWKIELVIFIIALALLMAEPRFILNLFKQIITRKKEN